MLSGIFWLILTLNETYEKEIAIPVRLVNVPPKVFITNEMTDTVRFVVRDKGYVISSYLTDDDLRALTFNFATYSNDKGYGVIPQGDIQKQLLQRLSKSSTLVSIKTDKIEFYYNYGESKRVPVRSQGEIMTGTNCYLSKVVFQWKFITQFPWFAFILFESQTSFPPNRAASKAVLYAASRSVMSKALLFSCSSNSSIVRVAYDSKPEIWPTSCWNVFRKR